MPFAPPPFQKVVVTPFEHGRLFGWESAKIGARRQCPYLAEKSEAIRGWYAGWDEWWSVQPEWKQKERPT